MAGRRAHACIALVIALVLVAALAAACSAQATGGTDGSPSPSAGSAKGDGSAGAGQEVGGGAVAETAAMKVPRSAVRPLSSKFSLASARAEADESTESARAAPPLSAQTEKAPV